MYIRLPQECEKQLANDPIWPIMPAEIKMQRTRRQKKAALMITFEPTQEETVIGLISDTHGRLPYAAGTALSDCDLIIHAGDIDSPDILKTIQALAPTVAVRGNMDHGAWAQVLPESEVVQIGRTRLYVLHILEKTEKLPDNIKAVIYGHTHQPDASRHKGVLFINPGSACAPRHGTPPSIAILRIKNSEITVEHYQLPNGAAG